MRRSLPAAAAVVALAFLPVGAAAAGLDGKTFHGEIVDDKGVVRAKDIVTFKDGIFHSVNCERFGFGQAPYWMRVEGDAVHFLVEMTHPDNGTMFFKGAVRGSRAEWSAVWTKKRWYWSIRRDIRFQGTEHK